jgi:hypothetical protein
MASTGFAREFGTVGNGPYASLSYPRKRVSRWGWAVPVRWIPAFRGNDNWGACSNSCAKALQPLAGPIARDQPTWHQRCSANARSGRRRHTSTMDHASASPNHFGRADDPAAVRSRTTGPAEKPGGRSTRRGTPHLRGPILGPRGATADRTQRRGARRARRHNPHAIVRIVRRGARGARASRCSWRFAASRGARGAPFFAAMSLGSTQNSERVIKSGFTTEDRPGNIESEPAMA